MPSFALTNTIMLAFDFDCFDQLLSLSMSMDASNPPISLMIDGSISNKIFPICHTNLPFVSFALSESFGVNFLSVNHI